MANETKTLERGLKAFTDLVDLARRPPAPPSSLDGAPPFKMPESAKLEAWRSINDGRQARIEFPNGYEASVVCHRFSYGGEDGLWELAVCLANDGAIVYDTPITNDVIGHLTDEAVTDTLYRISALPTRGAP